MRAYIVPAGCKTSDALRIVERPDPRPGPRQVLVRVRAASLNYRDQAIALGAYMGGAVARDTVPLSDGAGEVVEAGAAQAYNACTPTAVLLSQRLIGAKVFVK